MIMVRWTAVSVTRRLETTGRIGVAARRRRMCVNIWKNIVCIDVTKGMKEYIQTTDNTGMESYCELCVH